MVGVAKSAEVQVTVEAGSAHELPSVDEEKSTPSESSFSAYTKARRQSSMKKPGDPPAPLATQLSQKRLFDMLDQVWGRDGGI